ncbi:MAG: L-threonine ammonia-lyase [Firmicutes bacterium]|nr:L-threonine ammonia-lyase [Bacillota bacterium]
MIGLSEVVAAARRIGTHIHRTPLVYSRSLSLLSGNEIYLKCENLQKTGSFKIRGALNAVLQLTTAEQHRGVVTGSSGNHGQALAYAARQAKVRAVVVMPENVSAAKRGACQSYGGETVLYGLTAEARLAHAEHLVQSEGLVLVHPYDDARVIAGQGTLGLEVLAEYPEVNYLVAPVGGGGLLSGVALATKESSPKVQVIGVEPLVSPRLSYSWQEGQASELLGEAWQPSVADGLRSRRPGKLPYALTKRYVDKLVTVGEGEIVAAMKLILERTKLLAEPSGAVAVAAVLQPPLQGLGKKMVCVVSGGNIELAALARLLG